MRGADRQTGNPRGGPSRAVAARIVGVWIETGRFPDRLLEGVTKDRAFVMELVYGVTRWRRRLDWTAAQLTSRSPDRYVRPFLLIGLYQIVFMDSVAEHAAVHETVEAYKRDRGKRARATGYLNAVLRHAIRGKQRLHEAAMGLPLAVRQSHPDLLVSRWKDRYGAPATEALCAWNNTRPRVTIRVRQAGDAAVLQAELAAGGIEAVPARGSGSDCLSVAHGVSVPELPGFREGRFAVQDASTLAAVRLLSPMPGERVLDACAAPGGKTAAVADRMQGSGTLWALDANAGRMDRLRDNLDRLGLASVRCGTADVSCEDVAALCGGPFDRILLDVPCTNTGVLRRRPDARWRFSEKVLGDAVASQRALLTHAVRALRPGGTLVYSTCSLEGEEDEELVDAWLDENQSFDKGESVKLFPLESGTDGAYAAIVRERA